MGADPSDGGLRSVRASSASVPAWVWLVFTGLAVAAALCFGLSLLLGQRSLLQNGEGASGYALKRVRSAVPVERISAATVHRDVPLEMPLMGPTEVPPPVPETVAAMPQVAVSSAVVPPFAGASPAVSPAMPPVMSGGAVLPVREAPASPRWVRNAVAMDIPAGAPRLAIVIDDMGFNRAFSERALAVLPAGVTLSFLPYGEASLPLAGQARAEGHEVMVHIPMQPLPHGDVTPDMGPHGLQIGMTPADIEREMRLNLAALADLSVGANNHMGSRFTSWNEGMRAVLTVLQREGLLFLDSKTAAPTATRDAARGLVLPVISRDVFLDHASGPAEVRAELAKAAALARKKGIAVAIGHPLPDTLDVLEAELPALVSSGIVLVPISYAVAK